jgi:hypothetical protein
LFVIKSLAAKRYWNFIFLDDFPLLIKGNKLIPIDKKKNEECFINNGFYFPIIKKSKKEKNFKTIPAWTIGLQGLSCGKCVPTFSSYKPKLSRKYKKIK